MLSWTSSVGKVVVGVAADCWMPMIPNLTNIDCFEVLLRLPCLPRLNTLLWVFWAAKLDLGKAVLVLRAAVDRIDNLACLLRTKIVRLIMAFSLAFRSFLWILKVLVRRIVQVDIIFDRRVGSLDPLIRNDKLRSGWVRVLLPHIKVSCEIIILRVLLHGTSC